MILRNPYLLGSINLLFFSKVSPEWATGWQSFPELREEAEPGHNPSVWGFPDWF